MKRELPLGPVMLDIAGLELTPEDRELLAHPLIGGVVLFARNYAMPAQLRALTAAIHAIRSPPLLIAVDHEGGRVQRFTEGFTRLPPMRALGALYDRDPAAAETLTRAVGVVLAAEVAGHGVDFSFAPVLDLDYGGSSVIGDRAFHRNPAAVTKLARALIAGMHSVGVAAVGKHFPGHGFVRSDSHHEVAVDDRDLAVIEANDLVPYAALAGDLLAGIMPAHVAYPRVDSRAAGFSPLWLKEILRTKLRFEGIVFSDDLSMAGASVAGGIVERGRAALAAGCDMVLVCNARDAAVELVDGLPPAILDPLLAGDVRGPPGAQLTAFAAYPQALAEVVRSRETGLLA